MQNFMRDIILVGIFQQEYSVAAYKALLFDHTCIVILENFRRFTLLEK